MLPSAKIKLVGLLVWACTQLVAEAQPAPATALLTDARPSASQLSHFYIAPRHHTDRNSSLAGDLQRLHDTWSASRQARSATQSLRATHSYLQLSQDASAVLVRITARDVAALIPSLQARGFQVKSAWPRLHFVEGFLPISQLTTDTKGVTALTSKGLLGVKPSYHPFSNAGRVTSEADQVLETERVRASQPGAYNGTGVRIGVMSDSFNALGGAAADVASGDLPPNIRVLQDLLPPATGVTDEGRAMCQLIYDLAPGAQQVFSSVFLGEGDFAEQIRRLANPALGNCKVLTDDIRYYEEPFFQDGVVAQAINEVVAERGVTYFSSAGNYGNKSYENTAPNFVTTGNQGSAQLNFSPSGTDFTQGFSIPQG
ncbi:MAG TPA: hypothetical protein VF598_13270, partial [Hymenobacter sp.]